jgi:hypothetical protein
MHNSGTAELCFHSLLACITLEPQNFFGTAFSPQKQCKNPKIEVVQLTTRVKQLANENELVKLELRERNAEIDELRSMLATQQREIVMLKQNRREFIAPSATGLSGIFGNNASRTVCEPYLIFALFRRQADATNRPSVQRSYCERQIMTALAGRFFQF